MLQALGMLGNKLLSESGELWPLAVARLGTVDFSRQNSLWAGNVVIGGKVSKHRQSVRLAFERLAVVCAVNLGGDL